MRTRALLAHPSARLAVEPGRVATLGRLGDRYVLEYDRAVVLRVEHMFTTRAGYGHDLDLLLEIASTMPHLRFADFWHGYLRFLCAEALLHRDRVRP